MIDRLQLLAIVAIIVLSGIVLFNISSESQPIKPIECIDTQSRDKIRAITLQAINDAFSDNVMHLFGVWMRDEKGQPQRASTGMQQAIRGYLEARRLAESWNPPPC